jgi:hypothetical protein
MGKEEIGERVRPDGRPLPVQPLPFPDRGFAVSGIRVASGHLFFFYAYDAGFEIALEEARALCEASDSPGIAGLRPAPAHLQYRPRPLTVPCGAVPVILSGNTYRLDATMKIFDFGALSVTLTLPRRSPR